MSCFVGVSVTLLCPWEHSDGQRANHSADILPNRRRAGSVVTGRKSFRRMGWDGEGKDPGVRHGQTVGGMGWDGMEWSALSGLITDCLFDCVTLSESVGC